MGSEMCIRDRANMGFATVANIPVVLIGDIDRGGIIASIVGTKAVLSDIDQAQIKGFVINKFRGDVSLFSDGVAQIEKHTKWKVLGVIPWFDGASRLPAEDAMGLKVIVNSEKNEIIVAVPQFSRIANFDDLDPLRMEPGVGLILVRPGEIIPVDADIILLPGTKSTIGDLMFLREQGWHIDIASHVRRGGSVLGLCGGYQMLGKKITDPMGIESSKKEIDGLGFLDVETILTSKKTLTSVVGKDTMFNTDISGYEIHIGKTTGADCNRPIISLVRDGEVKFDGASTHDGRIMGSYIHGIFASNSFRSAFLKNLGLKKEKSIDFNWEVENTLDKLADHLEKHINVNSLFKLAR